MANQNWDDVSKKIRIRDGGSGQREFVEHTTYYNDFGRRSFDSPLGGGDRYNDHAVRNSDKAKCQISDD